MKEEKNLLDLKKIKTITTEVQHVHSFIDSIPNNFAIFMLYSMSIIFFVFFKFLLFLGPQKNFSIAAQSKILTVICTVHRHTLLHSTVCTVLCTFIIYTQQLSWMDYPASLLSFGGQALFYSCAPIIYSF